MAIEKPSKVAESHEEGQGSRQRVSHEGRVSTRKAVRIVRHKAVRITRGV